MMVMEAQPAVMCFDKKERERWRQGIKSCDPKTCRFSNFKWTKPDRDKQ